MFLKVENIDFKYDNSKENILNNFSMEIEKGEIVSIVGRSGCGKSTILRIISGLEMPTKGEVVIDGVIMNSNKIFVQPEKRGVGMLFQDYALFPHLTVEENIKFGLHKLKKEERDSRVDEVLNLVNLKEFKKRYPYELSGGQQQRIALARALAPKPKVLLMDEPFSNIDAELKAKLRTEIREILKREKATCIFVTHDIEDVTAICDKSIEVKNDRVV